MKPVLLACAISLSACVGATAQAAAWTTRLDRRWPKGSQVVGGADGRETTH